MPLSILIADNNVDHAQSLADVVTLWGHDAFVCFDPSIALDYYEKFWPDVMLLDIGFPLRSDGLAVARKARGLTIEKVSTIIAITGHSDDETRTQAKEAGFDYYFVKPIDLTKLEVLLIKLNK
ncbi:MAG: response regulator [Gemmatales bacterium]